MKALIVGETCVMMLPVPDPIEVFLYTLIYLVIGIQQLDTEKTA